MPEFENDRSRAIWEHGRNFEREKIINAINMELIDPDNDGEERRGYRLGLRMSIAIIMKLSFPEENNE